MRMTLTASPASCPVFMPLCGSEESDVTGSIGGAVVVVDACRGPAADADEDEVVSRQNSDRATPAMSTVTARRR